MFQGGLFYFMESTRKLPKIIIHIAQGTGAQVIYCKHSAVAAFIENKISV